MFRIEEFSGNGTPGPEGMQIRGDDRIQFL